MKEGQFENKSVDQVEEVRAERIDPRIIEAERAQVLLDKFENKISEKYFELEKLSAPADLIKKEKGLTEEEAQQSLPYETQWKISALVDDISMLERDSSQLKKSLRLIPYLVWDGDLHKEKLVIKKFEQKYPEFQ